MLQLIQLVVPAFDQGCSILIKKKIKSVDREVCNNQIVLYTHKLPNKDDNSNSTSDRV